MNTSYVDRRVCYGVPIDEGEGQGALGSARAQVIAAGSGGRASDQAHAAAHTWQMLTMSECVAVDRRCVMDGVSAATMARCAMAAAWGKVAGFVINLSAGLVKMEWRFDR